MDSGNSDSSSCGEDHEYDSRAAAFSSFMNHPVLPSPPPPPPPFDPFSNFLQLQNTSPLNPNVFFLPRNTGLIRSNPYPNNNNNTNIHFPFTSPPQPPPPTDAPPPSAAMNNGTQKNPAARNNTKKRSRASRRAPTTVLTTDTSNFRAMVQEFTGIPAPPFASSSSPFQRSRLDLYGGPSTMRLKSHEASQPPYLHPPPPPPQQPFLASTPTLPTNYQSISTQSSNLFNLISNQNLTSLLQTDHRFPFSNIKTNIGFDEFSLRQGNANLVSSDQTQPRNDRSNDINIINRPDEVIRNVSENNNLSRDSSVGKMNYLADSSRDFRGEKREGNIATRSSEGMMESWICSSELK